MSIKKRLMIDMDDVICEGGFIYLVNKFMNANYTKKDFENFYMQDVIPKERNNEWIEFFDKNNLYEYVNFIDNCFESLEKLSEKYEIFIITDYIFKDSISASGKILKDKFDWLQKNIPFVPASNYVFTSKKEIVNCDIRIDDKPSNLYGDAKVKLLFTAYHNIKMSDEELNSLNFQRVNSWKDIEKILL